MRTTMQHCRRLDWLLTRFVAGAILLHGFASLSGFAFAQASSSDDATRPTKLLSTSVGFCHCSGRVTIQDLIYTGGNGDTVPAYLVIPKGSGKFAALSRPV
jgi:hypothetical protein